MKDSGNSNVSYFFNSAKRDDFCAFQKCKRILVWGGLNRVWLENVAQMPVQGPFGSTIVPDFNSIIISQEMPFIGPK